MPFLFLHKLITTEAGQNLYFPLYYTEEPLIYQHIELCSACHDTSI